MVGTDCFVVYIAEARKNLSTEASALVTSYMHDYGAISM